MPFAATWMGLEVIIPSEVSQRNVPNNVTCMQNLKYDTNELIYKAETDSQTQNANMDAKGESGWKDILYKPLNVKQSPIVEPRDIVNIL